VSMVFSLWGGPVNALAAETPVAVEGSTEAMTEAQTTEEMAGSLDRCRPPKWPGFLYICVCCRGAGDS